MTVIVMFCMFFAVEYLRSILISPLRRPPIVTSSILHVLVYLKALFFFLLVFHLVGFLHFMKVQDYYDKVGLVGEGTYGEVFKTTLKGGYCENA